MGDQPRTAFAAPPSEGMDAPRLWTRTAAAFGFVGGEGDGLESVAALEPASLERFRARVHRLSAGSGKRRVLLAGLGSGDVANALSSLGFELLVLDPSPERTHAWTTKTGERIRALADRSHWALALFAAGLGFDARTALVLRNPEIEAKAHPAYFRRIDELTRLIARIGLLPLTGGEGDLSQVSFAACLAPDEPDLEAFFGRLPDSLGQVVIVWDGERPPGFRPPKASLVESVRPLGGDFSAQRNHMLSLCTKPFVLSLDADERLSSETWAALPGLLQRPESVWLFERRTLYPDAGHVKIGFGLWPDLQARLFRRTPGLRFVNPVHERLTGIDGDAGVVFGGPILHYNRLSRDASQIGRKFARYDAALGAPGRHRLSTEFPSIPLAAFPDADGVRGAGLGRVDLV